MAHIRFIKLSTLARRILNWKIGLPLIVFTIYIASMFIVPWKDGEGDWHYVQVVWYDWQAFNVGMLAFISSLIAFYISKYNAEKQRERNFAAAKAFLPESLSELTTYFKDSAKLLQEAWHHSSDNRQTPLETRIPQLPARYKEIFSRCIEFAEADVGDHLAYIIMRLQIHYSRIVTLTEEITSERSVIIPYNIISYIYYLGELQALVNRFFGFARGLEKFDNRNLSWEDFLNSFFNLDIDPGQIDDLIGFTKRAIERNHNANDILTMGHI